MKKLIRFLRDEEGVTALEYGLLASFMAVAIIAGATYLGDEIRDCLEYIGDQLKTE